MSDPALTLGDFTFQSRLIVGTGKYESLPLQLEATRESEPSVTPGRSFNRAINSLCWRKAVNAS